MELQKEFQKDRYRHPEFLEMISIKEDKLLKLFLKRNQNPIEVENEIF
ncbi:MAG: hypothetical protein HWN80_17200 [Candidatus Lokiarchaeota archaeon]|nr:hypothetical protein [Candidatus Lokiarchaeota archaeon]